MTLSLQRFPQSIERSHVIRLDFKRPAKFGDGVVEMAHDRNHPADMVSPHDMVRIDVQQNSICDLGLQSIAKFLMALAELIVHIGPPWSEFLARIERFDRILDLAEFAKRHAEIEMSVGIR